MNADRADGHSWKDEHAALARRVQAKTWMVIAAMWLVIATVVMFDDDASPLLRAVFVVIGLVQAAAGLVWLRAGRKGR
jgi:hypothetical protein